MNDNKLTSFTRNGMTHKVRFVETQTVKDGVTCDIYTFPEDSTCDLAIVHVAAGNKTPLQRIRAGEKTVEGFMSGTGTLAVTNASGKSVTFTFPGDLHEVELHIGDLMQWSADTDLTFYEICYPPYVDGRFENLE